MPEKPYPAQISTTLTDEELDSYIIGCWAVRRPLFIPSMLEVYGEVLSHSATLCANEQGAFLIEFMSDNVVYVKKLDKFVAGKDFDFEGFHFIYDRYELQAPKTPVTVRNFAACMANFMAGRKFDVFVHNCHLARYCTMKIYGIQSKNPRKVKKNILFQGILDFFFRPIKNDSKFKQDDNSSKKAK